MRINIKNIIPLALACLLLPTIAAASHDDAIPTGIRIQVTNVNAQTGQVDFDVLLSSYGYTNVSTSSSTSFNKELTAAWIGDRFFYDWDNPTSTTVSNTEWVLVDPTGIKALDFGDGNVIAATKLELETNLPRTYKGSFSHTYTMPGNYTITTKVVGVYLGNTSSPVFGVNYGNPFQHGLPPTSSSSTQFFAYRPTAGTSGIEARGNMLGISNTAQVTVNPQGGGLGPSIPIPSLDSLSKLFLGLFIALAGGMVLLGRR